MLERKLTHYVLRFSFLILPLLVHAGCTCGAGPYEGDYFDGDRPEALATVKFEESEKGDPKILGCADGQREAFADKAKFPDIAGCMAAWDAARSLRDKDNGPACGDDGARCAAPGDACAPGWHVCGTEGRATDLKERVSAAECQAAGPGRFNAGMSHGQTDELCPPKPTAATLFPCTQSGIGSEPVCCGKDCLFGKCKDAIWNGKTRISRGTTEGCGSATSDRNGGILCCSDQKGGPTPAPAADTAGAEIKADEGKAGDAKAEDGKAEDGKAEGDAKSAAKAKGAKGDDEGKADAPKPKKKASPEPVKQP